MFNKNQQSKNHFIIIDAYALVFRAYHALPSLTAPNKTIVGAVYGFTSMLLKILSQIKTTHVVVVFDSKIPTFRKKIYPAYKANRPEVKLELKLQFPIVREAAKALGLQIIEKDGYEADDIIATLTRIAKEADEQVTIVSSDKDLMQLINKSVRMFDPLKDKFITEIEVEEKFKVLPDKLLDLFALIGDSSDNIPGVAGIGPKGAAELIQQFHSVDNLLNNLMDIKQERRRQLIINNKENLLLSKHLIKLVDDLILDLDLDDLILLPINENKLLEFLEKYGFKNLKNRASQFIKFNNADYNLVTSDQPIISYKTRPYLLINNQQEFNDWLRKIDQVTKIAIYFHYEKAKASLKSGELIAIALAIDENCSCYIPIKADNLTQTSLINSESTGLTIKEAINLLATIMQDKSILKIGYNIKALNITLTAHGFDFLIDAADDIMLLSYLLNNGIADHTIAQLGKNYLAEADNELLEGIKLSLAENQPKALEYVSNQAIKLLLLHPLLKKELVINKLVSLYERIERPLIKVLSLVEKQGVKIDSSILQALSKKFEQRLAALSKEIYQIAGKEFNIGSPKQLGEILINIPNIRKLKYSKTGNISTGADILEKLAEEGHQIAQLILEWRQLAKLKNTYTDSLIQQINPISDKVHTSFTMAATSTGRLSSLDPNLQNIPIRSEYGNQIRSAFIASRGYRLLSADYSQIELRLLAHMADISVLKEAFKEKKDIHAITAAKIFSLPIEQVDPNMRRKAKAINFGIIYGISSFGLAKQLDISRNEAEEYINAYFREYPGIERYMESIKEFARSYGYVETIFKRRCYIKAINNSNHTIRNFAERAAINAPIQGTAADIIKKAMNLIVDQLEENRLKSKMILQVHDELLFEVLPEEEDFVAKLVKEKMENIIDITVPLLVELEIGNNWSAIHQ